MGFLNIGATVLTTYKADVKPHKRALRELKGEERKAQKEIISGLDKKNEAWEKNIATLGKVGVAVGAVAAAYMAAKAAFNSFALDAQLKGATVGLNMNSLKDATHGLIAEIDLLQTSAALMNSDFKRSQTEIQLITEYMLVLHKRGAAPMAEIMKEVTKAFNEANFEGLKRFGVSATGVTGTMETANAMMELVRKEVAGMGGDFETASADMDRAGIKMADAMRDMKVAIGEMVNALAPLIAALAQVAREAANAINWAKRAGEKDLIPGTGVSLGDIADKLTFAPRLFWKQATMDVPWKTAKFGRADVQGINTVFGLPEGPMLGPSMVDMLRQQHGPSLAAGDQRWNPYTNSYDTITPAKRGGGKDRTFGRRGYPDQAGFRWSPSDGPGGVDGSFFGGLGVGAPQATDKMLGPAMPWRMGAAAGSQSDIGALQTELFAQNRGMRGVSDIITGGGSGQLKEAAISTGAEAFQIFSSAASASFNAVISGSKGMAEAFREAAGSMIAAKASQLFAEGVYQTAMAVGYAIFSPPKAGAAAAAAGVAFAGAASLGVLARSLGFGGSTGQSAASGASAGRGAGFSATGGGGSTTTVIIGDDFGTDSRRRRQARARAALKRAEAADGSGSTVEFN